MSGAGAGPCASATELTVAITVNTNFISSVLLLQNESITVASHAETCPMSWTKLEPYGFSEFLFPQPTQDYRDPRCVSGDTGAQGGGGTRTLHPHRRRSLHYR